MSTSVPIIRLYPNSEYSIAKYLKPLNSGPVFIHIVIRSDAHNFTVSSYFFRHVYIFVWLWLILKDIKATREGTMP